MNANRRQFLQFLAASSVVAPAARAWAQQLVASHDAALLTSAKDALEIMIEAYHGLGLKDLAERSTEVFAINYPNAPEPEKRRDWWPFW